MPGVGPAIGKVLVATGTISAGTATVLATVAKVAIGVGIASLAARRAPKFDPGLRARNVTTSGSTEAQKLVYGEAFVSGPRVIPPQAVGDNGRDLWNVIALAGHECEAITDIMLDEYFIDETHIASGAAAGGVVNGGRYDQLNGVDIVRINKHLGTSTQTRDADLATALGSSVWSGDHRGRGICYIVTMFRLTGESEALFETTPRTIRAKVQGKKVYDPRLDSTQPGGSGAHRVADPTTWAWSDNSALCAADYIRDSKFGPENTVDHTRINWASIMTAADWCDVLVTVPSGTQKRATCNAVLFAGADPTENLAAILATGNLQFAPAGEEWFMDAGYVAPADSIDETEILEQVGLTNTIEPAQRINTIKPVFVDPNHDHQPRQAPAKTATAYLTTRDNGVVNLDTIDLVGVNSWYQAQRVAIWELAQRNLGKPTKITVPIKYAAYRPGERLTVTFSRRGWTAKIFRIVKIAFVFTSSKVAAELELREDDSGAYADPLVGEYDTETTAGTITAGEVVPIPSVDTIPGGINYGGGTWNIQLYKNQNASGGADDGEIRIAAGSFFMPDGTVRTFTTDRAVNTPYEGSTRPPDRRAFLVWGATDPATRFGGAGGYGNAGGMFAAIQDRLQDKWYAVSNSNELDVFTPLDTDFVVARFIKSSSSGGIDTLTAVVPFVEPTDFSNDMPFGWGGFEHVDVTDDDVSAYNALEWSISTAQAFAGERSLLFSHASGVTHGITLATGGAPNLQLKANARYIFSIMVYPTGVDIADGTIDVVLTMLSGTPATIYSTQQIDCGDLTADAWNQVRFEINTVAPTVLEGYIGLEVTTPVAPDIDIYFDAAMWIDATNRPTFQPGIN